MVAPEIEQTQTNHTISLDVASRKISSELAPDEAGRMENEILAMDMPRGLIIAATLGLTALVGYLVIRSRHTAREFSTSESDVRSIPSLEEKQSFARLVQTHLSDGLNYARRKVGNLETAHDILASVNANLFEDWHTHYNKPPYEQQKIFFSSIHNYIASIFRDRSRDKGKKSIVFSLDQILGNSDGWVKITGSSPSAEETVLEKLEKEEEREKSRLQLERIAPILESLEESRRKLAVLILAGFTHSETAKILNISTQEAVKLRWFRTCRYIRKMVGVQD